MTDMDLTADKTTIQNAAKGPEDNSPKKATVSKTTGIIRAVALGAHALFEGIAFGLLPDIAQAVQLTIGIAVHKSAAPVPTRPSAPMTSAVGRWVPIATKSD